MKLSLAVQESVVSEEIMHNLDTCEVSVVGEDLDGNHESLEVDLAQVQQRGLEISSSNMGMVIIGVCFSKKKKIKYQKSDYDNGHNINFSLAFFTATFPADDLFLSGFRCKHHGQLRAGPAPHPLQELAPRGSV